ncbi:MAG: hypothetical protein R8F63_05805 [Acidimicrobiales bacterium]|nr:hypothetical protein [Acidimicrobiales bacterium]
MRFGGTWVRGSALVVGLLAAVPASGGCSDDACALSCGAPVNVQWEAGAFEEPDGYRLCTQDGCTDVSPYPAGDEGQQAVSRGGAGEVRVRLDLLDANGEVIDFYWGSGTVEGECCGFVLFEVQGDALVEVER